MLEAVLVVVGLFAAAIISWAMSHRPDWWRVRTELRGFSWFAASVFLFFAFNLLAFNYLQGSHFLWFSLSVVAFGWFAFRVQEEFDSSLIGDAGAANAPAVRPSLVSAGGIHLFQRRRPSPNPRAIIERKRHATDRGEYRHTAGAT